MGTGASTPAEIEQHLVKWENAVNDLSVLCQNNKRILGIHSSSALPSLSSAALLSDKSPDNKFSNVHSEENVENERSLRGCRGSSLVSFGSRVLQGAKNEITETNSDGRSPKPIEFLSTVKDEKEISTNKNPKHNRQHILDVRKARMSLFKSYVDMPLYEVNGKLACNYFATVAIALSTVLGGHANATDRKERVTVEDIFFAAHVPLHLLHTESMYLIELFDIVREFIDVDNRFKDQYKVEVVNFDIAPTVGQVELGNNDVGDRQTKIQLPELRKNIIHEIDEETNSVIIFNYDPFVLEQEMTMEDDEEEEEEFGDNNLISHAMSGVMQNDLLMASVMQRKKKSGLQFSKTNTGTYAALIDYRNAVQFMVSLAHGVVSDKLHADIDEVPLNGLFKAIMNHDTGERARGYIRISKRTSVPDCFDSVPPEMATTFFSPELCSGKVVGSLHEGIHAHIVNQFISPHLVAFAWAIHLISGASENTHNHGRGLPVGDIIRVMRLPSDCFLQCDLSLERVYLYAETYLNRRNLDTKYALTFCPVITRVSRDNAVPTISVFDFESVLLDVRAANEDPEMPNIIMILQYNADVAHNVLGIASTSQWCILAGYDPETQCATLVDANQKVFCVKWTCPLDRLHKAITTKGYLILSRIGAAVTSRPKSSESFHSSISSNTKTIPAVVQNRVELIKNASHQDTIEVIANFPFPGVPFSITLLALALARIGISRSTFDDIINELPFHSSSMMGFHFGLEAFDLCLRMYLERIGLSERYQVIETHFDREATDQSACIITVPKFEKMIESAVAIGTDKCSLVVHFDPHMITILGTSKPFGDFALVIAYDKASNVVTLCDVNPNRFYRAWQVPIEVLHKATANFKHQGRRSRGIIIITKLSDVVRKTKPEYYRDFRLEIVPIQNVFQISPSPQVQALSCAFAQLGHFYSPEEIFYEAYLKTVADQRRRGSQAFAWRDVDVSLAILNKKIDCRVMTLVARKFIESRKGTKLSVEQLDEVEVTELPELLVEACNSYSDFVLLLNYDPGLVHGLKNMGSSVALIQSYDQQRDRVGMFECEYCLYGQHWECDFAMLTKAADLDNPGTSKYGFVKLSRKQAEKRQGLGICGMKSLLQSDDLNSKREKTTKFL